MQRRPVPRILRSSTEYTENDILIIDSSDEEVMRAFLAEKRPLKCFSAPTEALQKYDLVLRHWIKYLHAPTAPNDWTDGNAAQLLFFSLWEKLVEDFNAASPRSVLKNVARLREQKNVFFPNLDAVLNVLQLFCEHVMIPCLEATPFGERDEGDANKPRRWSTQSVNWLQSLRTLINRLEQARRSVHPVTVPTFDTLLAFVRASVKAWETFEKMDSEGKCFALSSYTYGLAEMFEGRGQYGVSILLLHRALDLYFCYWGIKKGWVIERTNEGFRYAGTNDKLVTVLESFKVLDSNRFFPPALNAEPDVRIVNDARNLLLMTHHVYGIKAANARILRFKVEALITTIEGIGHSRWSQVRLQWLPLPQIHQKCLFELEPSMNTYLAEVT
jgi:hypothetical protein